LHLLSTLMVEILEVHRNARPPTDFGHGFMTTDRQSLYYHLFLTLGLGNWQALMLWSVHAYNLIGWKQRLSLQRIITTNQRYHVRRKRTSRKIYIIIEKVLVLLRWSTRTLKKLFWVLTYRRLSVVLTYAYVKPPVKQDKEETFDTIWLPLRLVHSTQTYYIT